VSWTHDRARVAALTRSRQPTDPDLLAAKRDLAESRAEEYIKRIVDAAPPLTQDQRSRIAALLQSGGDSNAAA
jgi:hypothetical protein